MSIKGGFTLPGEAGYEDLTLELAKKWGADVIRDSDGTALSDDILNADYDIYSTICIIRDHNQWAKNNMDKLQQTFLSTPTKIATSSTLKINIMGSFFCEQFAVNNGIEAIKYWQVWNRTTNEEVSRDDWYYDPEIKEVVILKANEWEKYSVSFLAYRIWEEISMYNHTTNNWDKEHLMQIDPIYTETQDYLLTWIRRWCETHPNTDVVRFTSMFYNFVWIWGNNKNNRHLFTDWGSYDFTVSPLMLNLFEKKYGYALNAEDFINKGDFNVTHMPSTKRIRAYMEFVNEFVISFGKKLIDIVHEYNKKAYVFYDDSWVGIEPYNGKFKEFGFDGIIKCVFSGYEVRLCSGVDTEIHELRLHPYLFPVGLGGVDTFQGDGNPTLDAKKYWISVRRAILKAPIERIGLGGYLHLVIDYPDFCDYIEEISNEFRSIKSFHEEGRPYTSKTKVGVLHYWGKLRSWTLSGHFHETDKHTLIHINESLSGLPFEVSYIDFEDIKNGKLDDIDVLINAGKKDDAWSGGFKWNDNEAVKIITKWVANGGGFIGVNEPSAIDGNDTVFKLEHILGVDMLKPGRVCHGKLEFETKQMNKFDLTNLKFKNKDEIYVTNENTEVFLSKNKAPVLTVNSFGTGKGIYLSDFEFNCNNTKFLHELILYAGNNDDDDKYICSNPKTECTYFPKSKKLVLINNTDTVETTSVKTDFGTKTVDINAFETVFINL